MAHLQNGRINLRKNRPKFPFREIPGNPQSAIRIRCWFHPHRTASSVVIVIIGILATISLPAIKGMSKSNSTMAANRQLLDDLGYARQRAIADHTDVYVVFVPPNVWQINPNSPGLSASDRVSLTNLWGGQYTTYAMLSLRSVGDEKGVSSSALSYSLALAAQWRVYCRH